MYNSKIFWIFSYFSFYIHWTCFITAFASLVCIPIAITSSAIGLDICAIAAGIKKKKKKKKIKKKKKKHDKIVISGKSKFSIIKVLICMAFGDSAIRQG